MVPVVLELPFVPTAIEFLERELIEMVERNLKKPFPVTEGNAALIVMYDASSQSELDGAVEAASEAALAHGAIDVAIADTPERAGFCLERPGRDPGGYEGRVCSPGGMRCCSAKIQDRRICTPGKGNRSSPRDQRWNPAVTAETETSIQKCSGLKECLTKTGKKELTPV